ncbi:MAG: protein-export chaperone SecB [Cohaesibacteraceae bacterium]|nr:protein-export chaperone SecB [Cohaesibacteraceae bacterium]
MASENETNGAAAEGESGAAPSVRILAQYIKDLSFENPGAPNSLRARENAPNISIQINVEATPLSETDFNVELTLEGKAEDGEEVVFSAELVYGGVFKIENIPVEQMHPFVMIECPRLLFPFARQVIADVTQKGGFPPLMIDPIDFAQLYAQRMEQLQKQAETETKQ